MRTSPLLCFLLFTKLSTGQSISSGVSGLTGIGGGSLLGGAFVGAMEVLMHPEEFMNMDAVEHPRDIETRFFAGTGYSMQVLALTGQTGSASSGTAPSLGLRTELGTSFTYRDRLMLTLNGGFGLSGYAMRLDTMAQGIGQRTRNAEMRLAWHTLPQRGGRPQWSFGIGGGYTFQSADERSLEEDGFTSMTVAPRQARPYLVTELARFTPSGRDRYEIAMRYVKHLTPTPAWTNTSSYQGTTVTSQASGDHLGFLMRYHLGTRKEVDEQPLQRNIDLPASMDTLPELACKRQRITLKLWDDAEMDGDTVTVLLNGKPALVDHCLGHKPLKLRLDLNYGYNQLQVLAGNEGRIPPNTARGILRRGKGREELLIKTTHSRGEMFVLMRG